MIHYIIIRRDLPFGVTLAQVAHAAADSMEDWITYYTDEHASSGEYGPLPIHEHNTVVVLGVKNLRRLRKLAYRLKSKDVPYTVVREPDMPWNGQMMSIGVWPGESETLAPLFDDYGTYKAFEGPDV